MPKEDDKKEIGIFFKDLIFEYDRKPQMSGAHW